MTIESTTTTPKHFSETIVIESGFLAEMECRIKNIISDYLGENSSQCLGLSKPFAKVLQDSFLENFRIVLEQNHLDANSDRSRIKSLFNDLKAWYGDVEINRIKQLLHDTTS